MDWNPNKDTTSFDFLCNTFSYHQYHNSPAMAAAAADASQEGLVVSAMRSYGSSNQEKKKRLTSDQLESLERSFQEEIKLDPDRKMKLSRELGLQPRQIAVWFQNRRARWKAKQLEHLYDGLKREFDVVSKENQHLHEQVLKLQAMLRDQANRNKLSTAGYTDISGEETVESTADVAIHGSIKPPRESTHHHHNQNIAECNYVVSVGEYNPSYWAVLPSYPSTQLG